MKKNDRHAPYKASGRGVTQENGAWAKKNSHHAPNKNKEKSSRAKTGQDGRKSHAIPRVRSTKVSFTKIYDLVCPEKKKLKKLSQILLSLFK